MVHPVVSAAQKARASSVVKRVVPIPTFGSVIVRSGGYWHDRAFIVADSRAGIDNLLDRRQIDGGAM